MNKKQLIKLITLIIDKSIKKITKKILDEIGSEIIKIIVKVTEEAISKKIDIPLKEEVVQRKTNLNSIIDGESNYQEENDVQVFKKKGKFWDILNQTAKEQKLDENMNFSTKNMNDIVSMNNIRNDKIILKNPASGNEINLKNIKPEVISNLTKNYSSILKAIDEKAKFKRGL